MITPISHTPFIPMGFEFRDQRNRPLYAIMLRGTFRILPGARLQPLPNQEPFIPEDCYHGDPHTSSVKTEAEFAQYKPWSDITLNATAHAPGGEFRRSWPVGVKVGEFRRGLLVTGPRKWTRQVTRRIQTWHMENPIPCNAVPLIYENAYGGPPSGQDAGAYQANPLGKGYLSDPDTCPDGIQVTAPQVEWMDEPVLQPGAYYTPAGFGPIGRAWLPRVEHAGTCDQSWINERWPLLPFDFQWQYNMAANPRMHYPGFLAGNEEVFLEGLHPDGPISFHLPGYHLGYLARRTDGSMIPGPMLLDTLTLDIPNLKATLIWRAQLGMEVPLRTLELRMDQGRGRRQHG